MIFVIDNVLTSEELSLINQTLDAAEFVDGKTTAGWHARLVKHNAQLKRGSDCAIELKDLVNRALKRNTLFQIAVQPKAIHSMLFSRYEAGMSYGTHVDNAMMGSGEIWRSDVSFTLFLNAPDAYEGGELVIENMQGEQAFKLAAGSMIVYPSSTLHRVEPVLTGVRLVTVSWVQSLVRDPNAREILFDLDTVRRSLFEKHGKTIEFDLLSKSHANLLRRWADI
jgi:PKHD-type hydroxylase